MVRCFDEWLLMINIDKYIVAANITEYHIVSKLTFLIIISSKFIMIKPIISCKNVYKNVKSLTCLN